MVISCGYFPVSSINSQCWIKAHYVCVDPVSKLVMVHAAVEDPTYKDEPWALWSALVDQLG